MERQVRDGVEIRLGASLFQEAQNGIKCPTGNTLALSIRAVANLGLINQCPVRDRRACVELQEIPGVFSASDKH